MGILPQRYRGGNSAHRCVCIPPLAHLRPVRRQSRGLPPSRHGRSPRLSQALCQRVEDPERMTLQPPPRRQGNSRFFKNGVHFLKNRPMGRRRLSHSPFVTGPWSFWHAACDKRLSRGPGCEGFVQPSHDADSPLPGSCTTSPDARTAKPSRSRTRSTRGRRQQDLLAASLGAESRVAVDRRKA